MNEFVNYLKCIIFFIARFYAHCTCIVVSVDPRGCVFPLNEPFASYGST